VPKIIGNGKKEEDLVIENDNVKVVVKPEQLISSFTDKVKKLQIDIPTGMYTYPSTSGQTLSGLYVFNPKQNAVDRKLWLEERHIQVGHLQTVVHSFYKIGGTSATLCQSITINNSKNDLLKRTIRVTTKIGTLEYFEFTMRTDISSKFDERQTDIYIDNGHQSVKRQFYTFEEAKQFNLTHDSTISYNGLNGYASIAGTAFVPKTISEQVSVNYSFLGSKRVNFWFCKL
jgi:hypothetical protein